MDLWIESLLELSDWVAPELFLEANDISRLKELSMKNAGFEGTARVADWLLSMRATEFVVGLSATFSCTHNNPIWMHLIISIFEPTEIVGSIRFEAVPSFQFCHAWNSCWTSLLYKYY